eukprot:TRINITY_DN6330_c0_g1_i2.p2 TRINITY_DN6330_c0_g1~~TRINITY_DN6330_c0_g1_i2.p2  ORF type:complete len:136 (-),score=28.92 TRINITY_DN6330_c0_g1_i2:228-635(-)
MPQIFSLFQTQHEKKVLYCLICSNSQYNALRGELKMDKKIEYSRLLRKLIWQTSINVNKKFPKIGGKVFEPISNPLLQPAFNELKNNSKREEIVSDFVFQKIIASKAAILNLNGEKKQFPNYTYCSNDEFSYYNS